MVPTGGRGRGQAEGYTRLPMGCEWCACSSASHAARRLGLAPPSCSPIAQGEDDHPWVLLLLVPAAGGARRARARHVGRENCAGSKLPPALPCWAAGSWPIHSPGCSWHLPGSPPRHGRGSLRRGRTAAADKRGHPGHAGQFMEAPHIFFSTSRICGTAVCHSSCTCRSAAPGVAALAPVLELPCQPSLFQPLLNTSMAEEKVPARGAAPHSQVGGGVRSAASTRRVGADTAARRTGMPAGPVRLPACCPACLRPHIPLRPLCTHR